MNMDIIQSAAFEMLVNVALAVLALAGAYAVYYIRLGASKLESADRADRGRIHPQGAGRRLEGC